MLEYLFKTITEKTIRVNYHDTKNKTRMRKIDARLRAYNVVFLNMLKAFLSKT